MRIDVLTLFPDMFQVAFGVSIIKRAVDNGLADIRVHNIRDYTHDKHHIVDDTTYGGGPGMVMKPEPIFESVEAVKAELQLKADAQLPVILMSPKGRLLTQGVAGELSRYENLIIICGHYEGVDERVHSHLITDEISIGDYVLTGGELPAMVVMDAVLRLVPGVLGSDESSLDDSHSSGLLEYPQFTRPPVYRGWAVPDVLLSGNHAEIAKWRREQVIRRTLQSRPDLLAKAELSPAEKELVKQLSAESQADKESN
ncbi:MAG: tRNA (guanosine(37)-N1)-methyltransferase TrmD [Dehalococcoidales bacterium]|nr:tRNA (guanosine(37)-N1)-methyltransferase TrmD [Dehalococcoidales bacterium]